MATSDLPAGVDSAPASGDAGRAVLQHEDVAMAVNAYLMADKAAQDGNETAQKEKLQHLATIQGRYWRIFNSTLSATVARHRQSLEFTDDERMLLDMGLVDPRMLGGDRAATVRELVEELGDKGLSSCYYLTEWLGQRYQQLQLENSLGGEEGESNYASQLMETRKRVLTRLSDYFTGLPGIPLEVSESMRTGEFDNVVIQAGIAALREPRRKYFLRRRNLWQLREQVMAKAMARANSQNVLRLFEMLNEIYARDWRERYDAFLTETHHDAGPGGRGAGNVDTTGSITVSVNDSNVDLLMSEARQMRMRIVLMAAVDGMARPDVLLHSRAPRLTKKVLSDFLAIPQTFDRGMAELPPIVIVPGTGRGFFAWETGCALVSLTPLVGAEDSIATALAWLRMLDDRLNRGGVLRQAYEKKFPGGVFQNDFPADYRAWLTRLSKGEVNAMNPQRRAFFRENIGPDISGPLLPPNLRNVGPQTMMVICRRLEKQLSAGDNDVNLHRRLAALYWQQGNLEATNLQFNAAMQLAPNDGETLFAAGMFMRGRGDNEAANDCFRFGAERAKNSLWGIYCQDALANLL